MKIIPETPKLESPDGFVAIGAILMTSGEQIHVSLLMVLLAGCATNLMLVLAHGG
jgi:hypothetical protein